MSNFKHWNMSETGIAFDPKTGETFQFNKTAQFMFDLVKAGRKFEEIALEISEKYDISYERAMTDTLEFLTQLDLFGSSE